MELFVVIMLAVVLATATARYAVWFECDTKHAMAFVAATAAIVVVAVGTAVGGTSPTVGLVLILGVMTAVISNAGEYNGGLKDKATIATVIALAQLWPHVTTSHTLVAVLTVSALVLSAAAWRGWPFRTSCG